MGAGASREPPPTHIPLFSDLTTQEFIAVALLLSRRVAKVGEQIVREGDPGDSMFIVSTGEVRATVLRGGQQVSVATLRDGDFFGEMAVLSGEPRTATVTAVKATELLELSREHLREIESRHPEVEAKIRLAYDERIARSPAR
jgi:cAMP-dependent protein kinase regulator